MQDQTQGTQVERLQQTIKDLVKERDYFEKLADRYYEKAKRYEKALITIAESTSCDDTWDFVNRILQGKKIELPYRFNQV